MSCIVDIESKIWMKDGIPCSKSLACSYSFNIVHIMKIKDYAFVFLKSNML